MTEKVLVSIPRETVNDESVLILSWKTVSGTLVGKDQLICEVETSKAVMEIHAPAAGLLVYDCAAGEELPVGATICAILPEGSDLPAAQSPGAEPSIDEHAARLTAGARRAAAAHGIEAASFPPGTLVREADVLRRAGKFSAAAGDTRDIPARGVPVEWTDLPRRKTLEGKILRHGRELSLQSSVTSICRAPRLPAGPGGLQAAIIFAAARLLHKYPAFNAMCDGGRIGYYGQINVGWALDGGEGLVAPVIVDADRKSIQEIQDSMDRHVEAYLEHTLSPSDFIGGTFTVTDLSGHDVSVFQPLIAPGQSAILGIGKGPGYDGEMGLYLTLAFDHQLSEGRNAAEFLRDLVGRLETHGARAAPGNADSESGLYCMLCNRDSRTLQRLKLVLLKSEVPPGFVCSLCLAGW